MRTPRPLLLVGLALTAAGCGPNAQSELVARQNPVNVFFGAAATPTSGPVAARPLLPTPAFPGFIAPAPTGPATAGSPGPVRPPVPGGGAPRPPCPATPPHAVPALAAGPDILQAPAPARYRFRRAGRQNVGGSESQLSPSTTRQVGRTRAQTVPPDNRRVFSFEVTQVDGTTSTATTYQVDPGGAQPGLKIAQVSTKTPTGSAVFAPDTPVRILTLPATPSTFADTDAGTDPLTGNTLVVSHQTQGLVRVPACGDNIEAWAVQVSGHVVNDLTGKDEMLTATYDIATQYGGLIVADTEDISGLGDGAVAVTLHSATTIDRVPLAAQAVP